MKLIPNYLSITRIFLSFILALTKALSTAFLLIYVLCGITDILDGYVARKTNSTSKLGEKLDSVADFIMIAVLIVKLYPSVRPSLEIITWMAVIIIIRAVSAFIVVIKFRSFGMLHSYGNKFTGLLIFIFPLALAFIQAFTLIYIICIAATISAAEELLIHLSSDEFDANRKSFFVK